MLYALIALIASLLGACCGLGGGVIIKPLLDAFTNLSAAEISLFSTFCVLTIALTSVIKYITQKTVIDFRRSIILGAGASLGGSCGTLLFRKLLSILSDDLITFIQSVLIAILLSAAIIYMTFFREKISFKIKNSLVIMLAGAMLGTVASFLGIGGGPINVALTVLLFSLDIKSAAVSSLVIILLSQITKIVSLGVSGGITGDLTPLFILLPVAFCGALLGAWLNKRLKEQYILTAYNITVCCLIGVTVFNAISSII